MMEVNATPNVCASWKNVMAGDSDCCFIHIECGPRDSSVEQLLNQLGIKDTTNRAFLLQNQEDDMLVFNRSTDKALTMVPAFIRRIADCCVPYHLVDYSAIVKANSWILAEQKKTQETRGETTHARVVKCGNAAGITGLPRQQVPDATGGIASRNTPYPVESCDSNRRFVMISCEQSNLCANDLLRRNGIEGTTKQVFLQTNLNDMIMHVIKDNKVITKVGAFMCQVNINNLETMPTTSGAETSVKQALEKRTNPVFFHKVDRSAKINKGSFILAENERYNQREPQYVKCIICQEKIEHMILPCGGIVICIGCVGILVKPTCPYCREYITDFRELPKEYNGELGCNMFRVFVGGPMEGRNLRDIPGLGKKYCQELRDAGYGEASLLLTKYQEMRAAPQDFKWFLIRTCKIRPQHYHYIDGCIAALEEYCRRNPA